MDSSWKSTRTINYGAVNPSTGYFNPQGNNDGFEDSSDNETMDGAAGNIAGNAFGNGDGSTDPDNVMMREIKIRVPTNPNKKYNVMRFSSNLCVDLPQYNFVRMRRDDANEDRGEKPWLLKIGTKNGKTFQGRKEGALSNNKNYFVFTQSPDGYIDAYPLQEWHTFHPVLCYKTFSAEEAEEAYEKRDKILNYFPLMRDRKNKNTEDTDSDIEECEQAPKKSKPKEQEVANLSDDDDKTNANNTSNIGADSDDDVNYYKEIQDEDDDEVNNSNNYYED